MSSRCSGDYPGHHLLTASTLFLHHGSSRHETAALSLTIAQPTQTMHAPTTSASAATSPIADKCNSRQLKHSLWTSIALQDTAASLRADAFTSHLWDFDVCSMGNLVRLDVQQYTESREHRRRQQRRTQDGKTIAKYMAFMA